MILVLIGAIGVSMVWLAAHALIRIVATALEWWWPSDEVMANRRTSNGKDSDVSL